MDEKKWKSGYHNPANARLVPNNHGTAFSMEVGATYFTPSELREFGQWLIAQADELELAKEPEGFGLCSACKHEHVSQYKPPCCDGCFPVSQKHWTPKDALAPAFKVGDRVRVKPIDQWPDFMTADHKDTRKTMAGLEFTIGCEKTHIMEDMGWPDAWTFKESAWLLPSEALELVKPAKSEKRFHSRPATRELFTHDEARKQAEEYAIANNQPCLVLEVVETCKPVEKKTVEVEWLK